MRFDFGFPTRRLLLVLLSVGLTACAAREVPPRAPERMRLPIGIGCGGNRFAEALELFALADAKSQWDDDTCKTVSQLLDQVGDASPSAVVAYDEGLVAMRCRSPSRAANLFRTALNRDPKLGPARRDLALLHFADGTTGIDETLDELRLTILDDHYRDPEALVAHARLSILRGSNIVDDDGANDLERAKKNLQRALAVDDASMSARDGLSFYYLETAKRRAGVVDRELTRSAASVTVDRQSLDLALLVTSQAIAKRADYAPIYNTRGLILVALGDLSGAASSFDRARTLDSRFYEAHMNFAALNLQFRGFAKAEEGYRAALTARIDDYDAHLGLALALRGEIDGRSFDTKLAEAKLELARAKRARPTRPEAYFNEAVLTSELETRMAGPEGAAALAKAKSLYGLFVERAAGRADLSDSVLDVTAVSTKSNAECSKPSGRSDPACRRGRIQDIDEVIRFTAPRALDPSIDERHPAEGD